MSLPASSDLCQLSKAASRAPVEDLPLVNPTVVGWEGLKAYTFETKQSKDAHFEKFSAALRAAKLLHIFSRRASRGAARPVHVKFASYAYATCTSQHQYKRYIGLSGITRA